ncbi:hypothetical protein ACJMK2_015275 [Sinanodonta woodiana]|uniref:DZIP3-like HEPN domain-containing protein n=1 Tax=Sinanodonta woodiana TaxID=1069815 RepID=A0ABD3V337_SINWO
MSPSGPSPEDTEDEKQDSEVPISDDGKQPAIEVTSVQIGQEIMDIGQSNVESEKSPPGPSSEDSENGKQVAENHTDSEVPNSDEEKQPVIEGTSTQIRQEIPIEQSVEEKLNHAGMKMSTEERDLFIKFQNEIGTDIFFSDVPHRLTDSQESIKTTEIFIEQNHPDMKDSWLEYKSQGKLTLELIDVIYAKERDPDLHDKKDEILGQMEDLNIIVKARSFDENGVKEENYLFTPCMLRPKSEREVVAPDKDPRLLSKTLYWDFTGTCVPSSILDRILAACIKRWPVAKKKETSKHLLSPGYAVFDLDLTHRLTVHCENHDILATVTWLVIDDIETPDENVCTIVRRFISNKLSMITRSLNQNLQYEMYLHSPDGRIRFAHIQMWFKDEIYDPESPMTREHINHARLYIALVTVCGNALRYILVDKYPVQYPDIYQAILGNHAKLTKTKGRPPLNKEQINIVFPDPLFQKTGTVDKFDITLLYTLIRNVSSVQAPTQGWGNDPLSSDTNLGDSVERIRIYRNHIGGHSPDAKIDDKNFADYWKKFEDVLHDIEVVTNKKVYTTALDRLKGQVISIFDAC